MRTLISLLLTLISLAAIAQQDGIIYGKNHVFKLTAPHGWTLDNKAGVHQGLHAVFYPEGENWTGAQTVAYAHASSYENGQNIDSIMNFDLSRIVAMKADVYIKKTIQYPIGEKVAYIREVVGDDYGNYELIAYIPENKCAAIIVMTSKNMTELEKWRNKFGELLNSYVFLSDDESYIEMLKTNKGLH